jgi:hypothetical protein
MMTVLAVSATACNEKAAGDASSTAATTTDSGGAGACRLLKTSEVSANLSKAEPGKAETTREKYGITACEWSTEKYRFAAQYWTSEHPSAQEEASGLSLGALDPLKPGVGKNVRYETIQGVGDQAVAVIEKQDAARGILNDFVMLVAQKGNTILVLFAPELADTDRAQALRALQTLGKSAAERL